MIQEVVPIYWFCTTSVLRFVRHIMLIEPKVKAYMVISYKQKKNYSFEGRSGVAGFGTPKVTQILSLDPNRPISIWVNPAGAGMHVASLIFVSKFGLL